MTVTVRATLRVHAGGRDAFLAVAAALSDAARDEPGTLRYAWFAGDGPDEVVVLEDYVDADAGLAHNEACAPLLARMGELATMTSVRIHGELSPALEAWVASRPEASAHPPLEL